VTATSTSRRGGAALRAGLLAGALACALALPATAQTERLEQAIELYDAADYRQAVDILEQLVATRPSSEAYHWLGRAYGQLAEESALFRALKLARRTRNALERAVELDKTNRSALEDLLKFHEQAPAIAGGSKDRAVILKKRLAAMEAADNPDENFRPADLSDS